MGWYLKALRNYAVFSGRAQRMEFWMFTLFYNIFSLVTQMIDIFLLGAGLLSTLFYLGMVIPMLAVTFRRLHDTGHSGWWILFPIWVFFDSHPWENQYGPNPKNVTA